MRLKGKVAIITGASRGVGKGIAKVYGREGAAVVVAARTDAAGGKLPGTIYETAEEIKAEGGIALPVRCDVQDEASVKAMVNATLKEFGQIDVLINNAGGAFSYRKVVDFPIARFDQAVAVNIRGPFLCCQAVLPTMIKQKRGVILNMTSGAAFRFSRPGDTVYGLTKAALDRFSTGLAWEVREHNISVVSISPGQIKTEGIEEMYKDMKIDWSPFRTPEEVGPAFVWLAQQTAKTFTMRVVLATDFGRVWP